MIKTPPTYSKYYQPLNIFCSTELFNFLKEKNLNPVYIYENLNLIETQRKIVEETKNLSGIYLILNKKSLHFYVGSAATGRFNSRFRNHLFNFCGSKIVKLAVKKEGILSFAFIILELFPEPVTKENNKKLIDLEDFYLKTLLPDYNILTEAGSSFGYKHTEITRLKMKNNYSIERKMQIRNLNKGRSLSAVTKEKLRQVALKREKLRKFPVTGYLNLKKKSKRLVIYNLDLTVVGEFLSIVEASQFLKCSTKSIQRALKTTKHLLRGR